MQYSVYISNITFPVTSSRNERTVVSSTRMMATTTTRPESKNPDTRLKTESVMHDTSYAHRPQMVMMLYSVNLLTHFRIFSFLVALVRPVSILLLNLTGGSVMTLDSVSAPQPPLTAAQRGSDSVGYHQNFRFQLQNSKKSNNNKTQDDRDRDEIELRLRESIIINNLSAL